ncbi:MAG: formate/nitrite family transporter [Anaerolineales bacterium]|jgi:formate/nitrite transporter
MEKFDIDAYVPAQMAVRVEKAGIVKGNRDFFSTFTLAMMAGSFIGLGAAFFSYVIHDSTWSVGLTKLIGGLVFSLGLILVIITGSELFTGNNLIVMAFVSRKITFGQLLNNWGSVFVGNLVGSIMVVFLVYLSGQWTAGGGNVGVKALMIANGKVNLTFLEALSRGILCNILVCLAVYLCFSGRSVTDKILAILFPITAFVALGFEHSIANMYFIPAGLLLKGSPDVLAAAQDILGETPDLSNLTIYGFMVKNLLPVTFGNIIGGTFFVGLAHWFLFLRPAAVEPIRKIMTSGPPVVDPNTTIAEVVRILKQQGSSSVLVGEPGNTKGIVSEADVVRKVMCLDRDPAMIKADQIMTSPLISVDIATPVYKVYRTMADHHIRHILITDGGKQIGFISVKDLIAKPVF